MLIFGIYSRGKNGVVEGPRQDVLRRNVAALNFGQMNGGGTMGGQNRPGEMSDSLGQGQVHQGIAGQELMQHMTSITGKMSGMMQVMSGKMRNGKMKPAQRNKIQARLDAMQKRFGKMEKEETKENK